MLLGFGFLCLTLVRNIDPLVRDMAVSGAKNAATTAMQKAVAARMTGSQWSDLVQLVKDSEGQITAAVTDVGLVNELQAALAGDVIAALTASAADLGVPLGNLLPSPVFSGLGPKVPIRILSVTEVEVRLLSRFSSAGINQTLHRLLLTLSAKVRVLIPTGTVTAIVYADVPAAETVIVGRVPDSYMYFESSERWDDPLEQYDILN
jgi:sporulation protein YunB